MEGSLEQSKFEDDCRDMFGISSYILFTIDKLIVHLAKQLQILITDDSCAKLLALYAYEGSRPRGSLEVIYHSNVLELLPEDDRCFRFEFSQESCELTIQLLDSTDKPRFVDLSFDKDKWAEYVENYVQSDKSHLDVRKHKVFLLKNQRKWAKKGGNPMENVVVSNGLECKICLTTYRLFYVQDTHDFFYRRGSLAKARKAKKRVFGGERAAGGRPEIKSLDDIAPTYTPPPVMTTTTTTAAPQPEAVPVPVPEPESEPQPQPQPQAQPQ
jgi:paired amphipathic helix protein Sin3a